MQPQPIPMHSPYRTQKGQHQGGSYSGQGGGHGHHGPTRLHQQSPKFTSGHQHLQSSPQGPHPTSKTNSSPYSRTSNKLEASAPKNTKNFTPPVQHPKFYGLPKIHKTGTPLRPIVSSRGPSLMVLPRSCPTSSNHL